MPVDYINLDLSYLSVNYFENHSLLNFQEPLNVDCKTAEVIEDKRFKPKCIAYYKNMKFEILKNGKIYLKGSLHIYFNGGHHNYNQFTRSNLLNVLNDLKIKFGLIFSKTTIHHIEFGLNLINLKYKSDQLVPNILFHSGKGKPFLPFKYENHKTLSDYKCVERDQYKIKAYDKSKQYQQSGNNFRLECKANRMQYLNDIGLRTLEDLIKPEILLKLGGKLISLWDEVTIGDWTIREEDFEIKDLLKLKEWRNPIYWQELYQQTRLINRNKFNSEVTNYRKIVQCHSQNIHEYIRQALLENWKKNII